ncbi:hypothetical protein Ssed_3892 [Shewanella sediminis HAW-EB3]|uniref:Uncharacterized protein n=1 Tax=Shewanella sediminis (strain HAW-EB3) TaxID=425104 RepID=A8G073_SHESH|nr:hypothetical protein [Shewanella sediminis]ABV38496.1 hypothetical protein Ssed_3892 [Shewanella sediminis HAW-EB3]
MLIYCRFALVVISFILLGCSGSDDSSEEVNLPPVIELQAPSSALSLEQLTITAQVTDPENDSVSLSWQLTSNAGFSMSLENTTELNYLVPFTKIDTAYTVTLLAEDSQGNQTTLSSEFTVAALAVDFSLPFGAVTQRHIDVEANIRNIATENLSYQWRVSQGSEYPLIEPESRRVRFYAAKGLTEDYNPDSSPEYRRGLGITEEMQLTFSISHEGETLNFDKAFTIQPIQKVPEWPLHTVPAKDSVAKGLANNVIQANAEQSDNCLNKDNAVKHNFDFNQDGVDDIFCSSYTYYSNLYFYLSNVSSTDEITYTESILIGKRRRLVGNAELIDLNQDGIPVLVLVVGTNLISFSFDASTLSMVEKELIDLDYYPESYQLAEKDGTLSMAIEIYDHLDLGKYLIYQIKALIFDIKEPELRKTNEISIAYCMECWVQSAIINDLGGQTGDELIIVHSELRVNGPTGHNSKLNVVSPDYTKVIEFGAFHTVYQEDIDNDSTLELVGFTEAYWGGGQSSYGLKLLLSLDQNEEPLNIVLKSYYNDILFDYAAVPNEIDINQDGKLDKYFKNKHIDNYYKKMDLIHVYRLADSDREVLIARTPYGVPIDDFIGLADMNNDGYLDIKFGHINDNQEVVTSWLENEAGYPFE